MQTRRFFRTFGIGATILAASGGLISAAGLPASAAASSKAVAPVDLTVVGAQTTQELLGALVTKFNASSVAKKENATATNIYAQPPDPGTVAPSDANCNGGKAITYIQESNPGPNEATAPNGGTAGRTALANSVNAGTSCISIARSTSPGSSTDPAGTQAYAFAVDGVTWARAATSDAPGNLSMTQLEGVYDCTYTNWKQVGGKNAAIDRFYPATGSGIATFFAGVLGFDPRVIGGVNKCATPATTIEQNEATAIPSNETAAAITIFSGGSWSSQANGVDPDARNGFTLGEINKKGSIVKETSGTYGPSAIVKEANVEPAAYNPTSNTAVQGINNLFNFINTNSVDYTAAASFVGAKSVLCTNGDASTITKYGFHALTSCLEQS